MRWRNVSIALTLLAWAALTRRAMQTWGTRGDEAAAPLAGDDVVPSPDVVATRAITIDASPDRVWPWLAQMGQGRGGFYSWTALENLFGCEIRDAESIVPAWQHLSPGDAVRLHPDVALEVADVDQDQHVVLQGGVPIRATSPPPYAFSWAFVLRRQADGGTRLIVRERYAYTQWWSALVVQPVQPIAWLMTAKMLRGIRDRAERAPTTGE